MTLTSCKQRACSVRGAIVTDVKVDGLGREGRIPFFLWAPALRHVVLRGKLSAIKINPEIDTYSTAAEEWNRANKKFYAWVDWALDIAEAEFQGGISLEAVPGDLVRRDSRHQILVRRTSLADGRFRKLALADSSFIIALDWFLERSPYDSVVLSASLRSARRAAEIDSLRALRDEGIADPN